jgi:uroporphyrinogen decarboxylase
MMTSKERFQRMYAHKEADRIPIIDDPWGSTMNRWHREGLPENQSWEDYFGIDKKRGIGVNITPLYPHEILEDTPEYQIVKTQWGVTMKNWKFETSTPEFLDYTITTPETWEAAKARMKPTPDRINWDYLKTAWPIWQKEGAWTQANFWFGFDVTHSWMSGTETVLMAMYEDPDWVQDMFNTYLDMCIGLFEQIWDAGYHFDSIHWPDDMGYKGTTFFSNEMYREMLKPVHKRAVDWAHNHGIYAHLHSCGNIMSRIDDLMEIGLDALNPLEVKAGMEPLTLKKNYGDKLVLHGGINAVLWDDKEAIIEEIRRVIPALKENGGYIFSSDHSVPNSVSLENFRAIIEEIKVVGKY